MKKGTKMEFEFSEIKTKENKDGKKVGRVECNDRKIYMKDCPLDEKQLKSLAAYNKEYTKKATDVLVEKSVEEFNKDSKLDKVIATVPLGGENGGHYGCIIDRKKKFTDPKDKTKVIEKSKVKFFVHTPSTHMTGTECRKREDAITELLCKKK